MGKRKSWGMNRWLAGMSCYQESAAAVYEEEVVSALSRELLIEKEIRFRDFEF